MTQKEFEQCTGEKLSAVEFCTVNDIYMASGEMDKDTFCKDWLAHSDSKVLAELWKELKHQRDIVAGKTKVIAMMEDDRMKLCDFLLERAQKFGDSELLTYCVKVYGYGHVIRRKMELELPLWEADKAWLIEALKGIE